MSKLRQRLSDGLPIVRLTCEIEPRWVVDWHTVNDALLRYGEWASRLNRGYSFARQDYSMTTSYAALRKCAGSGGEYELVTRG